ncbi:MAG: CopG family transcriptional regulator [Acidobacteria bacterium]|nr:CopG family transcriptional regulator [Acidobacteriota bacterium]
MMETQNVTLSLPKELVRKAKIIAVERQTSISGLLKDLLIEAVAQEDRYAAARSRHLEVLHRGMDLGTRGMIRWTREEIHE